MNEIIQTIKEDPNCSEAKKLWRKFKNDLEIIGGHVMYGALKNSDT